jgi:LuxR family transcriptional regulator, maltose regulon positive regulatory protein
LSLSISFLSTKLYIPQPNTAGLVRRDRLFERLSNSKKNKLFLVSAAAGFGKTTLLADWIQREKLAAAWISLDESDNDPLHFWRYILFGLQAFHSEIGKSLLAILETSQAPTLDSLITNLINQLMGYANAGDLPDHIYIVLDDFHVIQNEQISASLNFLLDHIPPFLHLIIATRSDPHLNLARRRARGEVTEVRVSDLRFTIEETRFFFNEILHLDLRQNDIAILAQRTEGWAAGLQLAGLSIHEREDRHRFIMDFAGNDRYIADYLLEEVLQTRNPEVQEFMRKTALLERLSVPLCNFLLDRSDGRVFLDEIEEANLFLVPLDNRREWYRYHHLFAELLYQRLLEIDGNETIQGLYKKASEWHEKNGSAAEAIQYALAGKDYERSAHLIEDYGPPIFINNELRLLLSWIEKLPQSCLSRYPRLGIMTCWALVATLQLKKAEDVSILVQKGLQAGIEDLVSDEKKNSLSLVALAVLAELAVIQSSLAINHQDLTECMRLCNLALSVLVRQDLPTVFNDQKSLMTIIHFNQGLVYELSADLIQAASNLDKAARGALETENLHIISLSLSHLAQIQIIEGKLYLARETFQRSLDLSSSLTSVVSPLSGLTKVGLGNLFYEWNDHENARQLLEEGVALAKQWNNWEALIPGYGGLAKLFWAEGKHQEAYAKLDELKQILKENRADGFLAVMGLLYWHFWLLDGKLAPFEQWLVSTSIRADMPINHMQQPLFVALARYLAIKNDPLAENLIERLIEYTRGQKQWGRLLEALITKVLWHESIKDRLPALEVLREALRLAETEDYVRIFADEGAPMARLLYQLTQEGFMPQYTARLLSAFSPMDLDQMEKQRLTALQSPLVEPLSEREIEVLSLIDEGLSNAEIAQRLTLSITTVKSHTRNINLKLGTNSRTQAAARARSLGIL